MLCVCRLLTFVAHLLLVMLVCGHLVGWVFLCRLMCDSLCPLVCFALWVGLFLLTEVCRRGSEVQFDKITHHLNLILVYYLENFHSFEREDMLDFSKNIREAPPPLFIWPLTSTWWPFTSGCCLRLLGSKPDHRQTFSIFLHSQTHTYWHHHQLGLCIEINKWKDYIINAKGWLKYLTEQNLAFSCSTVTVTTFKGAIYSI